MVLPPISEIKTAERQFHDNEYSLRKDTADWFPLTAQEYLKLFKVWQITPFYEGGWNYWGDVRKEAFELIGDVRGKRLLDYGCGSGETSLYFAMQGAQVWGFDLSSTAIEICRRRFQDFGLPGTFDTMDAEALEYADGSFDVVLGVGVMHHVVKYPRSAAEAARVLRSGGRAVFVETLWDNPVLNWGRKLTLLDEQAGDFPLTSAAIRQFARGFNRVTIHRRNLLYMLKRFARPPIMDIRAPLKRRPWLALTYQIDQLLLKIWPLSRLCGEAIIELTR